MEFLSDAFNRFVDVASVVAARLGELPFAFLMLALGVLAGATLGGRVLWRRLRGAPVPSRRQFARSVAVVLAVGAVLVLAQRTELLLRESRELQYYVRRDALDRALEDAHDASVLIDVDQARRALPDILGGEVDLSVETLDEGVELACLHAGGPHPVTGFVSVVDLTRGDLGIEITEDFGPKEATSAFAREHGCVLAINGEAGKTPSRDAPLGSYTGTWIVAGTERTREVGYHRPYVCFDRRNRGHYVAARDGDAEPSGEAYNALWGRGDLLVDGRHVSSPNPRWSRPGPRTLMGLDEQGDRLVLAVIDGRQPGYSLGVDLETAARLMEAFGARDAMWCDQGGSSTMVVDALHGVLNRPSDGRERPVYTHFGVSRSGAAPL